MNKSKQNLVQEFMSTSVTLKRIISRLSSVSLEEKMATILQFQALTYLREHKNATVGELAQDLAISSSAVAQLIDRLLEAGRIARKNDLKDRRIIHISLTPEGKKEQSQMKKKYIEKMTFLLTHISEKDLHELIRIQTELITKLEEKCIPL
jgi:DNA-binding MarR family transcriptional regulator